jgi:hypothetical protein
VGAAAPTSLRAVVALQALNKQLGVPEGRRELRPLAAAVEDLQGAEERAYPWRAALDQNKV